MLNFGIGFITGVLVTFISVIVVERMKDIVSGRHAMRNFCLKLLRLTEEQIKLEEQQKMHEVAQRKMEARNSDVAANC